MHDSVSLLKNMEEVMQQKKCNLFLKFQQHCVWPAGCSCTVSRVGLVQAVDKYHQILGTRLFSQYALYWRGGQQPQPGMPVTCSHGPGKSWVWNMLCTGLFGTEQHTKPGNGMYLSLDLHVLSVLGIECPTLVLFSS